MPGRKMELGWLIETKEMVKLARGKVLTCFRRISSKLEPTERRVVMKNSGLQCLAGQIIQIAHGRQAEG